MREQICTKFWEATSDEHGKEPHGTYHGDSREAISDEHGLDQHGTYHDDYDLQLERTTAIPTCSLSASMQSATKQRNNFIFEQTGAGNNRAREHFTEARN